MALRLRQWMQQFVHTQSASFSSAAKSIIKVKLETTEHLALTRDSASRMSQNYQFMG